MTNVERIEILKAKDEGEQDPSEQWYYNAIAGNGETVVTSQRYASQWNAERAAKETFPDVAEIGIVRNSDLIDRPLPDPEE